MAARVGVLAGLALLCALLTAPPCFGSRPDTTRHLAPTSSPAAAPGVRAAGGCRSGSEFWTGSRCLPCADCAGVGKYTASLCSETQDTVCASCQGKPAHASWVTRGNSSSTSCTWLCDAGFNENRGGECAPCTQCPAGSVAAACGYDEQEAVPSRGSIPQDGSSCFATCSERNKYFAGVWSAEPRACECVSKKPTTNQSQAEGACQELSKPLAAPCAASGQRSLASFTKHAGLFLVGARAVPLPSASDFIFAELDEDGDGGVSLEEMTKHLERCCAGQGPHALESAVRMFMELELNGSRGGRIGVGDIVQAVSDPSKHGVVEKVVDNVHKFVTNTEAEWNAGKSGVNGVVSGQFFMGPEYKVQWEDGTLSDSLLRSDFPGSGFSTTDKTWSKITVTRGPDGTLTREEVKGAGIASDSSAVAICLAMCQTDAICDCASTYSVNSSGAVLGPGCFFARHPCETITDFVERAALPQPSPSAADGAVYAKTAAACLVCPAAGSVNANGTCVCGSDAFLSFASAPPCTDSSPGVIQAQPAVHVPNGASMEQAKEHCAAVALAQAAPVFCVHNVSLLCSLYNLRQGLSGRATCGPPVDNEELQCFLPELECRPLPAYACDAPLWIEASNQARWVLDNGFLDNGGWESRWMPLGDLRLMHTCAARCLEGHFLSFVDWRDDSRHHGWLTRHKCVDRRIRDAWLATYALLWLLVAGAAAFFAWRFYVRPDNRCACGVGWVYRCAEHRERAPSGFLSCNGCKCDSGLVCEAPDWQTATRRWGALLVGVQTLAIALSAVHIWEWDRLFLGGFPLFFRVDDGSTEPWDIPGHVNSADLMRTVSLLIVLFGFVVPWVMFHDRCVLVAHLVVLAGWYVMNVANLALKFQEHPYFSQIGVAATFLFLSTLIFFAAFFLFLSSLFFKLGQHPPHATPYRLCCCRCARREPRCGPCSLREAGGTFNDNAWQAAATVKYSAQYDHLKHQSPWYTPLGWEIEMTAMTESSHIGTFAAVSSTGEENLPPDEDASSSLTEEGYQAESVRREEADTRRLLSVHPHQDLMPQWSRLIFHVSSWGVWARHDKPRRTISSFAFSELTGSSGCTSGKRAYHEVEVVLRGGCLQIGYTTAGGWSRWLVSNCKRVSSWHVFQLFTYLPLFSIFQRKLRIQNLVSNFKRMLRIQDGSHKWWVVDCRGNQVLMLQEFSSESFRNLSAGDHVCIRRGMRLSTVTTIFRFLNGENDSEKVMLDGYGEELFSPCLLYQVVTKTVWDVSVSEGDVIGLACDLDKGNLRWSLNGDWSTGISIDLEKNEHGKYDTMWPFIALEASKASEVPPPIQLQYADNCNLKVVVGQRTEFCVVGPVSKGCPRLNYTVRSTGAPLPPGLVLDSATGNIAGTSTGEIMEEFQLGLPGEPCCEVHVEASDMWGRKQKFKLRIKLFTLRSPKKLSYPSAHTLFFPPAAPQIWLTGVCSGAALSGPIPVGTMVGEDLSPRKVSVSVAVTQEAAEEIVEEGKEESTAQLICVQAGVEIHIPAEFDPGFPVATKFFCENTLPTGLHLHSERGDISGVPMTSGHFETEIQASNSIGSIKRILQITVHEPDVPSGLSYPAHRRDGVFYPGHQYEIGEHVRIEPDSLPRCKHQPGAFQYFVRPTLPTGWDIDSATGVIEGEATEELQTTLFVVTAVHMGADCCAIIRIKVAATYNSDELVDEQPEWQIPKDLASFLGATIYAGTRYETNERLLKTHLRRGSNNANKHIEDNTLMNAALAASLEYDQAGSALSEGRVKLESTLRNRDLNRNLCCAKFSCQPALPKGLEIDLDGQIRGIPLELSTRQIYTITAEHPNFSCSAKIVLEIQEPENGLPVFALGLEWMRIGPERPTGTEISNVALAQALQRKLKWTRGDFKTAEEFNAFMVPKLTCNDFIKVGDMYYAPSDACDYSEPIRVPRGSVGTDHISEASTEAQRSQTSRASAGQSSDVPEITGFAFEEKLGAGGQGTVWLATFSRDQTKVAIKMCQKEYAELQEREMENLSDLSRLQHPNIVRYMEFRKNECALIMEYVDGMSLGNHLQSQSGEKRALQWDESSMIMRGILSGLKCLHRMNGTPMVHRDVKPENVMLSATPVQNDTNVILVDFGLAKRMNAGQTLTVGERFIGTIAYMSPELCRSERFDTRVDVWSAGVVFYEMLVGDLPFSGGDVLKMIEAIKNDKIKRIRIAGVGIDSFIQRALAKKTAERFTDAADMLEVFEEVCKNPHSMPEQLIKPQRPSPLDRKEPQGRPRIAAFFAKKRADVDGMLQQVWVWARDEGMEKSEMSKEVAALIQRDVERLDLHQEAETLMLGFEHPRSLFEVDVHAQPTFEKFSDCMLGARNRNVRVLHLAGHSTARCGFAWLKETSSAEYQEVAIEEFAKLFETETSGSSGTIECVVLNACESEGVGKRLRIYGVPHVVCWRSEVRDVTAMRFSATFYKALDCQSDGVRDYKRAFEQAAQPARMRSSEPTSSQARKPAKHQAPGAVDFICLLSKDGDVFPEPSKEATKRLDAGPNKMESESSH